MRNDPSNAPRIAPFGGARIAPRIAPRIGDALLPSPLSPLLSPISPTVGESVPHQKRTPDKQQISPGWHGMNVHPSLMSKPRLLHELDTIRAEAHRQKALADYWKAYADEVAERHRIDTAVAEIVALRNLVLTGRAPRTVLHPHTRSNQS